jgi:hypothetical protein
MLQNDTHASWQIEVRVKVAQAQTFVSKVLKQGNSSSIVAS